MAGRRERAGRGEAQEDRLRALVWRMSTGPIAEARTRPTSSTTSCRPSSSSSSSGRGASTAAASGRRRRRPRGGRGGDARAHLRARASQDGMDILDLGCGWGSLVAVARRAVPDAQDHRRLQLHTGSGSTSRPSAPRAGSTTSRSHRRRQRLTTPAAAVRPRGLGRDVRAHAQLEGAAAADRRPG